MARALYVLAVGSGAARRFLANDRAAPGFVPIEGTACGLVPSAAHAGAGPRGETRSVAGYWSGLTGLPCAVVRAGGGKGGA